MKNCLIGVYLLVIVFIIYWETSPPKYALITGISASAIKEYFLPNFIIDWVYYSDFLSFSKIFFKVD